MGKGRLIVSTVHSIVFAYAVATCVAAAAIVVWTQDAETIGAGLLVPMMLIPAITGYAVFSGSSRLRQWRHVAYLALGLPMPLYLLSIVLFPSQGASSDGAEQWALAFFVPLVAASISGYAVVVWRDARKSSRMVGETRSCSS
jgi:hypothetical protein